MKLLFISRPIEAGKADTSQMRKVKSPERDNSQGIVTHDVICDNLDSINHSSSDQDPPLCNGTSKNLEEKISYEGTVLELNKNQSKSLSKNGFEMPVGCLTSTNRADKLAANVDELNKPLCIVDASPPDPKKQCLTPVLGTPMESSSTNAVPHFDSIPNDLHVSKSFSESDKQDNACPLLGPNLVDEMTEQFRENNKENLGIEIPLDDDEELLFGPTTPLQGLFTQCFFKICSKNITLIIYKLDSDLCDKASTFFRSIYCSFVFAFNLKLGEYI